MSIEEIAKAMHIPKGTVKSRLHKARMILKSGLEAEGSCTVEGESEYG
jgi:RNA polymerase sigma-70 factor (ECF subfamily)